MTIKQYMKLTIYELPVVENKKRLLNALVHLDNIAYRVVFELQGLEYKREDRMNQFSDWLSKHGYLITVKSGDDCMSIMLIFLDKKIFHIENLVTYPNNKRFFYLRIILRALLNILQKEKPIKIKSKVFSSNKASIALHTKLGMIPTKKKDGLIHFISGGECLQKRLENLFLC